MNTRGYGTKELWVTCIIVGIIAGLFYGALLVVFLWIAYTPVNVGSMVGVLTYAAFSAYLERKHYASYSWFSLFVLFLAVSLLGACAAIGVVFVLMR